MQGTVSRALLFVRSENLPGQFQFFFGREQPVEFLNLAVIHIVALRSLINSRNIIEITRNQFLAEKERVILSFG